MNYRHALILYQTVTPLHVGCGQDVGVVDLPIIRERTTGYPLVPGSGIRGSWRDLFRRLDAESSKGAESQVLTDVLFGPEPSRGEEIAHAGCVAVHDARLLLFPVRSDRETFLWLTCPAALRRFSREIELFSPGAKDLSVEVCGDLGEEEVVGPEKLDGEVHLEEFLFRLKTEETARSDREKLATWAGKIGEELGVEGVADRTVLLGDSSFSYFVRFATIIEQHNRLTSAKTVEGGALFSLEALPPETVLYGFVGATDSREQGEEKRSKDCVVDQLRRAVKSESDPKLGVIHLGGHESTGLGVTRLSWVDGEAST